EGEYKLPAVQAEGVVLTALSEVSADPDPIRVRVASPSVGRTLLVGAYARGRLLDHRRVTVAANQFADVELRPEAGIGGVTRVTAFEELPGDGPHKALRPRAERLVFRKPAATLKLTAEPDKARYVPGDHVTLSFRAQDEKDQPAAAIAVVGVVNKSVVTMADEKTFRTMPTHFLLTSEVRRPEDLEHADVLLGTHPKAAAALDLLLGTQGWRRFAEQATPAAPNTHDDDSDRILLANAHSAKVETNSLQLERRKVEEAVGPAVAAAQTELATATERLNHLRADPRPVEDVRRLQAEIGQARAAVQTAQADVSATLEARERFLGRALPAACGLFLAVALCALVAGLWRGLRYYVAAAGSLGLAAAAALVLALHTGGPIAGRQAALGDAPVAQWAMKMADVEGLANRAKDDLGVVRELEDLRDRLGEPAWADRLGRRAGAAGDGGDVQNRARYKGEAKPANDGQPQVAAPPAPAATPAPPAPAGAATVLGVEPATADKAAAVAARKPPAEPAGAKAELAAAAGRPLNRGAAPAEEAKKPMAQRLDGLRDADRKQALEKEVARDDAKPAAPQAPAGGFGGGLPGGAPRGVERGNDVKAIRRIRAGGGRGPGLALADAPPPPFVVREYAHRHSPAPAGDRTDFAETVFWHPVLVLPKDGAKVSFDLSDDVTRYQVLVAAHTLDGRLGALTTEIEARKPFSLEPKLPVEITAGDRIDIPVTLANDT
ncbi:MAG TPA: alpha-2-macroglobulin family protein, partial [Gemmataceae bacterium]